MMMAHRTQDIRIFVAQEAREKLRPRLRMRFLRRIRTQNELPYIMKQRRPLHALTQIIHSLISSLCRNHKDYIRKILLLKKISCLPCHAIIDFSAIFRNH